MAQFKFKKEPDRDIVNTAIYQRTLKQWEKKQQGERPTLEAIRTANKKKSATESLVDAATHGRTDKLAPQDILVEEEAKALGGLLLEVEEISQKRRIPHPELLVKGTDDKFHNMEPKEISGWMQANAKHGSVIAVNDWLEQEGIDLTGHVEANGKPQTVRSGHETIKIEINAGKRRVVGNGVVTKPMDGYYGGVEGTKVGDGDLLDIYLSKEIYADMKMAEKDKSIKPYNGPVFVMQQKRKGDTELKVGFAKDENEFKRIMTSTWDDPQKFERESEGSYVKLSYEQYNDMKKMLRKNPSLTIEEFAEKKKIDLASITVVPDAAEAPELKEAKLDRALKSGVKRKEAAEQEEGVAPPMATPAKPKQKASKSGKVEPAGVSF